jgi:hypothetical protein
MTYLNPKQTCDVCKHKDTCPAVEQFGGNGCDNHFEPIE